MSGLLSFPDHSTIECFIWARVQQMSLSGGSCISGQSPPPAATGGITPITGWNTHNLYSSPIFIAWKYSAIRKSFNKSTPPTVKICKLPRNCVTLFILLSYLHVCLTKFEIYKSFVLADCIKKIFYKIYSGVSFINFTSSILIQHIWRQSAYTRKKLKDYKITWKLMGINYRAPKYQSNKPKWLKSRESRA